MITAPGKTCVIGVKGGDFDYCQTAVKTVFNDEEFVKKIKDEFNVKLTSANSINWVRLLPQISYSFYAYMNLVKVILHLTIFQQRQEKLKWEIRLIYVFRAEILVIY